MSGHSKWSTIKRQKGANDAKRGQAFTKAGNALTVAAREGGGNPDSNFKLRLAIDAARAVNMPKENIERAITRATGTSGEKSLEEVIYEGYGPAGVAIMIDAVTDNKIRTTSEIRSLLERAGGSLGGPGSVNYLFKATSAIDVKAADPDQVFLAAADAGAEDVEQNGESVTVYTVPQKLEEVKEKLRAAGFEVTGWEVSKKAASQVAVNDPKQAETVLNLVNRLEDLDDVQKVYANFDISEEILEKVT
ncbi:MAG: YebC/PmpR family DNA-binding transcriptional regulator [bacterium]|nr:YebC/PmpR family DNA-binding transcriptional regulator [bacterium]